MKSKIIFLAICCCSSYIVTAQAVEQVRDDDVIYRQPFAQQTMNITYRDYQNLFNTVGHAAEKHQADFYNVTKIDCYNELDCRVSAKFYCKEAPVALPASSLHQNDGVYIYTKQIGDNYQPFKQLSFVKYALNPFDIEDAAVRVANREHAYAVQILDHQQFGYYSSNQKITIALYHSAAPLQPIAIHHYNRIKMNDGSSVIKVDNDNYQLPVFKKGQFSGYFAVFPDIDYKAAQYAKQNHASAFRISSVTSQGNANNYHIVLDLYK